MNLALRVEIIEPMQNLAHNGSNVLFIKDARFELEEGDAQNQVRSGQIRSDQIRSDQGRVTVKITRSKQEPPAKYSITS